MLSFQGAFQLACKTGRHDTGSGPPSLSLLTPRLSKTIKQAHTGVDVTADNSEDERPTAQGIRAPRTRAAENDLLLEVLGCGYAPPKPHAYSWNRGNIAWHAVCNGVHIKGTNATVRIWRHHRGFQIMIPPHDLRKYN